MMWAAHNFSNRRGTLTVKFHFSFYNHVKIKQYSKFWYIVQLKSFVAIQLSLQNRTNSSLRFSIISFWGFKNHREVLNTTYFADLGRHLYLVGKYQSNFRKAFWHRLPYEYFCVFNIFLPFKLLDKLSEI